jgi:hypothetical protein
MLRVVWPFSVHPGHLSSWPGRCGAVGLPLTSIVLITSGATWRRLFAFRVLVRP